MEFTGLLFILILLALPLAFIITVIRITASFFDKLRRNELKKDIREYETLKAEVKDEMNGGK